MARYVAWAQLAVIGGCLLMAGCVEEDPSAGTPVARVWEAPTLPQETETTDSEYEEPLIDAPPATQPIDRILAVVNGEKIYQSTMVRALIESHGLRQLEEMILLIRARQQAAELGLSVTQRDIDAAHEDALLQLQTPIGGDEDERLSRTEAERLLNEFLAAKNISRNEWNRRMEQRAYLRAIAKAEVSAIEITQADLEREYRLAYGERVQIRHIQLSSLAAVDRAKALLREKKDFELVARQLSENQITAARGGLLPPFARNDAGVTPLIREAAFELKPGNVSPAIHEGNWYHLIRVEQRFPASEVGFDNVDQDKLRERLIDRLIRQQQESLEADLFNSAVVDIRNRELDQQFQARHRRTDR
jgi:parvulin-like peptidyl-prolyl isomerase